jgi:hypothetical protein
MTDIDPAFMDEPTHETRADVETLGYLLDGKQPVKRVVTGNRGHRVHPFRWGWAWTVMDVVNAAAARCALVSGFMMFVFASFLLLGLVSRRT